MKVPHKNNETYVATSHHHWVTALFMVLGFGILAVAGFWIRKCNLFSYRNSSHTYGSKLKPKSSKLSRSKFFLRKLYSAFLKMFNMYQKMNRQEDKEGKEPDVIGHDRFCQERPSRSSRRKKPTPKRAQSMAEFTTLTAAHKRSIFGNRSLSSENKESKEEPKIPQSSGASHVTRHEYSALRRADSSTEKQRLETQVCDGTFIACRHFLATSERYELRTQLENIGSRSDKHWFIVQDITLGAERLLSLVSLTGKCPIKPSQVTRETVLALFRGLQHPYIHPVLDIEFWDSQAALISPLNHAGSLRDLIYSCTWHEEWDRKYTGRGEGLPLWQVQRLGRQILEALLFLRDRSFPPFYHLHSGNVILQNGVARLAGLENPLLGMTPRPPSVPDTLGFGHLLFEMTTGYELPAPPSPAHLQLELERVPRVAEVLRLIFQDAKQPVSLEELLCCDLFRGVELRELRGINATQCRSSTEILELLDIVRQSVMPAMSRRNVARVVESRQLEDILEEDLEENDSETFVKVWR